MSIEREIAIALNAVIKKPKVQTADQAAKAAYDALIPLVIAYGQNPETELFWRNSETAKAEGRYGAYVSWESGPYQWAIPVSMAIDNRLSEPHYSFDLCFYSGE